MTEMTNTKSRSGKHHCSIKRAGLAILGALFCGLFATSCASSNIKRLSRPLVSSPLVGDLLASDKLTSDTRKLIEQQGLASVYRVSPAKAISTMHQGIASGGTDAQRLAVIELCSDTGERLVKKEPLKAVAYYLAAADLAFEATVKNVAEGDVDHLFVLAYNHSSGQVAKILFDSGYKWKEKTTFKGPWKSYHFHFQRSGDALVDPTYYDSLESVDYIELKNKKIKRIRREGIGAAMIAHRKGTSERREANPHLSPMGMTLPVNAILDFRRGSKEVQLKLTDLMLKNETVVRGRALTMSSDLTVPLAIQVDYDVDRKAAFKAMISPDKYSDHTGLYTLQPFRSNKIPVVFVHGLMSNPEVWVNAINQLRADPLLRQHYQLFVFRYPSGYPIAENSSTLRNHLKEFQDYYDPDHSNPKMRQMLLIGHSMGGILTNAQVRRSGDAFTGMMFNRPIEQLENIDDELKAKLKEYLIYDSNPDITRAIFVAGPHRGSNMATSPIGSLGRRLMRLPSKMLFFQSLSQVDGLTDIGRSLLMHRPDSIENLKPGAPVLTAILENPVRKGTTVHSIIGHHDLSIPLEESSDGTVPYRSAHLDEAVSEKVFHAKHTPLCSDPGTIEEMRRILYLHAGLPYSMDN